MIYIMGLMRSMICICFGPVVTKNTLAMKYNTKNYIQKIVVMPYDHFF
jgi:hypothetical protein